MLKKFVITVLIVIALYQLYSFFAPDRCPYNLAFRADQHYYFKRYNSYWFSIKSYPDNKTIQTSYQKTACPASFNNNCFNDDFGGCPSIFIDWDSSKKITNQVDITWYDLTRDYANQVITGLDDLDVKKASYVLLEVGMLKTCQNQGYRNDCVNPLKASLRAQHKVPDDYLFTDEAEARLKCLNSWFSSAEDCSVEKIRESMKEKEYKTPTQWSNRTNFVNETKSENFECCRF